jgi:hypothetical protein
MATKRDLIALAAHTSTQPEVQRILNRVLAAGDNKCPAKCNKFLKEMAKHVELHADTPDKLRYKIPMELQGLIVPNDVVTAIKEVTGWTSGIFCEPLTKTPQGKMSSFRVDIES